MSWGDSAFREGVYFRGKLWGSGHIHRLMTSERSRRQVPPRLVRIASSHWAANNFDDRRCSWSGSHWASCDDGPKIGCGCGIRLSAIGHDSRSSLLCAVAARYLRMLRRRGEGLQTIRLCYPPPPSFPAFFGDDVEVVRQLVEVRERFLYGGKWGELRGYDYRTDGSTRYVGVLGAEREQAAENRDPRERRRPRAVPVPLLIFGRLNRYAAESLAEEFEAAVRLSWTGDDCREAVEKLSDRRTRKRTMRAIREHGWTHRKEAT